MSRITHAPKEMKRMDSPYGIPSSMILYDKTKEEIKSHPRTATTPRDPQDFPDRKSTKPYKGERFGEPYRSENYDQSLHSRDQRYNQSREKTNHRTHTGPRRSQERREHQNHQGRHPYQGRVTERVTERVRSEGQRRDDFRLSQKNTRETEEWREHSDEDFDIRSKEVIVPMDDIKKITIEMCCMMDGSFTIVEGVVDPLHDTSVYFSESKNVDKVFTFIGKKNPDLVAKLEKSSKIQIIEDSFVYTPPEVKNPFVLFLYPYWLMSMDEKNVQNVYFKNIPLQSGTFDDILRIEQADLFVFVIPKDVRVPEDYGDKRELELSRGKLVLIRPKRSTKIKNVSQGFYDKQNKKDISEEEWNKNFELFLKNTLSPVAKEDTIHKIINSNTLSLWKKAFTHETIDLNDNYEQLETIGDRVLELCFLKYLLRKFPDLSPQEITELKSKYMSKIYQGTTSRKLGFGDWIRVGNDISTISILEDVFESFFGALFEISDNIIGDGVGYVLCLKFLTLIFEDVKFDLSKAQGHPRSQIKEIFEMLKLDPEIQDVSISEKGTNVTISISDHTHNELVELEKISRHSSKVIGIGFGPYKINAVNLAYSNALEYLEGLGITRSWAERQKELYDLMVPELDMYIEKALERMVSENYDRMYIRTSRTSVKAGNVVIQLVGEYMCEKKGKIQKKILTSGKFPDIQTGKIEVVKQYANY